MVSKGSKSGAGPEEPKGAGEVAETGGEEAKAGEVCAWRGAKMTPGGLRSVLDAFGVVEAFTVLADLMPAAGVFVVDRDRQIRFWSRGAEKLLGFQAEHVLGQYCLRANRCPSCLAGCGIAEKGFVENSPLTLYHSDGRPLALRKTGRAFFDSDGDFLGGIEILTIDPEVPAIQYPRIPPDAITFHGLLSRSPAMHRAFEIVRNVAPSDTTVLVRGDSGTGKEYIARALHQESHRQSKPFLAVNCAALTPTLLESELFGHVKGSFTGAVRDRAGLFQQADGGTLFLDEIAEIPLPLQAKLLRVLQERSFVPVGGTQAIEVDVRIIAATHQSLRDLVQKGRFREDLMYRLRVVPIYLPPLRERREDIELLFWHFLKQRKTRGKRLLQSVSPEAMRLLLDHPWPGNVREMQNVVDYIFAVGQTSEVQASDLPPEFSVPPSRPPSPVASGLSGRSRQGAESQPHPRLYPPPSGGRSPLRMYPPPPSAGPAAYESDTDTGAYLGASEATEFLSAGVSRPADSLPWPASPPPEFSSLLTPEEEKELVSRCLAQAKGHVGHAATLAGMSRTTFWRKRRKYGV